MTAIAVNAVSEPLIFLKASASSPASPIGPVTYDVRPALGGPSASFRALTVSGNLFHPAVPGFTGTMICAALPAFGPVSTNCTWIAECTIMSRFFAGGSCLTTSAACWICALSASVRPSGRTNSRIAGYQFGWKSPSIFSSLVDSALLGSHDELSFFCASLSFEAKPARLKMTSSQTPNTTHLDLRPDTRRANPPGSDSALVNALPLTKEPPQAIATLSADGSPSGCGSDARTRLPAYCDTRYNAFLPRGGELSCTRPNKMLIAAREPHAEQRRTTHMTDTGAPAERTLVLLKPDAVARGMMGRVLTRFEDALLKVVGSKMVWMDAELTRKHYFDLEERFGAGVYNATAPFMQTGTV